MGALTRGLAVLELLSSSPEGMQLGDIAKKLEIPSSATHRLLTELVEKSYLRQSAHDGTYALSMKMVTLTLSYLSRVDLVDLAKPSIDRLAAESGVLARLAIPGDGSLTWVLKAQGSRGNIKYDPPMDYRVQLSCSASGHAWLSTMDDETALETIFRQGLVWEGFGPNAPRTVDEVVSCIRDTRERGYAVVSESYEPGVSAIAVPIVNPTLGMATGVLSIAGPKSDIDPAKQKLLIPSLQREAGELASARLDYAQYLLPVRQRAAT
ncbi:IclR family transcriptional regulator [Nocardia sp. NPDC050799]|uniref:IclR family transcriptional regulator n=1 Tax=Nocardia TaxID=1817 RepID=UPI0007A75AA7|nr:IclR family transcriptional regulator [Nocardia fusca]